MYDQVDGKHLDQLGMSLLTGKGRSTPLRNKMINTIGVQGKIGIHKIIPREMSWVTTGATPAGSGVMCVIRHFN